MKYKAFISCRHNENSRRHAVALETALKRYAKPTLARPMKIFRDEKHMKPDISLPKLSHQGDISKRAMPPSAEISPPPSSEMTPQSTPDPHPPPPPPARSPAAPA